MPRAIQPLALPTGPALLHLLPALDRARRGEGPALLPYAGPPPESGVLTAAEDADDDPTAFVLATSGSTGDPKQTLLTAAGLAASAAATRARLAETARPGPGQWLLALPAAHVAGLQVLLRALAEGSEPTVLDTAEPFTAAAFLQAAGRMPAGPRFVSLVPTQLHRILAHPEATGALAGFDAVLVGGAATAASLLAGARAAGIRAVTTYGMTETGGGCVYDGRPLDGVQVLVGADETVALRGPVVARGYRGRPDDPAFPDRRTFVTGDRGRWHGGRLQVVGRRDDVIVTGGVKIDPAAVEAALAGVSGVAQVLVVGIPDAEWGHALTALVVPGATAPDPDRLRLVARERLGPAAAPKHVLLVDDLPRRGIGKPDRTAAADLARAWLQ